MGFVQDVARAAGGFTGAYQSYWEGINEQRLYQANADQLRARSEANTREAQYSLLDQRRQAASLMSGQRADWGGSGVAASGTGTVNEVALASRLEQEIADKAYQAMQESRQLDYQAQLSEWQGSRARFNSKAKMFGNLFEGIGYTAQALGGNWPK